ncbi:MAG: hypothetical protein ACR2LH_00175 [Thermoleophilaceae bacterium]
MTEYQRFDFPPEHALSNFSGAVVALNALLGLERHLAAADTWLATALAEAEDAGDSFSGLDTPAQQDAEARRAALRDRTARLRADLADLAVDAELLVPEQNRTKDEVVYVKTQPPPVAPILEAEHLRAWTEWNFQWTDHHLTKALQALRPLQRRLEASARNAETQSLAAAMAAFSGVVRPSS